MHASFLIVPRLRPPISDFIPIKKAFSRLNARLRKTDHGTVGGVWVLISGFVEILKPVEVRQIASDLAEITQAVPQALKLLEQRASDLWKTCNAIIGV